MVDFDDADDTLLMAAVFGSPVLLVLALLYYAFAFDNAADCAEMRCERGKPTLMAHECLCVEVAR